MPKFLDAPSWYDTQGNLLSETGFVDTFNLKASQTYPVVNSTATRQTLTSGLYCYYFRPNVEVLSSSGETNYVVQCYFSILSTWEASSPTIWEVLENLSGVSTVFEVPVVGYIRGGSSLSATPLGVVTGGVVYQAGSPNAYMRVYIEFFRSKQ